MPEVPRTPVPGPDAKHDVELPNGLLEALARRTDRAAIRPVEVARGRLCAVARAYDNGHVVEGIASALLVLSR